MILSNHMHMTREEFDQARANNRLVLTFVGMSNIGKTHWAKEFAQSGFEHINCDDRIEAKLAPELTALGYSGIADVSKWMGQPYEDRFPTNQQRYLELEGEVMQEVLREIEKMQRNTIIDTTGSVIHVDPAIGEELKRKTLVVYIKATSEMKEQMFQRYIKEPKPVVFGDVFKKLRGESDMDALKRCYPMLLEYRSGLYQRLAHIVIPRETIAEHLPLSEFVTMIQKHCDLREHERQMPRR